MSLQSITDYLEKQLYIEKNVVTYRSLSRAQGIHVNVAKNELANYFAKTNPKVAATYLLSGLSSHSDDADMDVDMENEDLDMEYDDGDFDVPQTKIVVAAEKDLEAAQSQFSLIHTIHVYSLSPGVIKDSGHLCPPTDIVREIDNKKDTAFAAVVGQVIGKHVSIKPLKASKARDANLAGPSKLKPTTSAVSTAKGKEKADPAKGSMAVKEKLKPQTAEQPKEKPKASGKLDFGKAKPKVKEEGKEVKKDSKPTTSKPSGSVKETKPQVKEEAKEESIKPRGTKRKSQSALVSDSEEETPPAARPIKEKKPQVKEKVKEIAQPRGTKRKSNAATVSDSDGEASSIPQSRAPSPKTTRVLKKTVLSSDDEAPQASKRKGKGRASIIAASDLDSAAENELRDMMDIDDDNVIRASRNASSRKADAVTKEEEEEEEDSKSVADKDEDTVMAEDTPVMPKKQRKPKKVVPVGRNGIKKKRTIKSKTSVDAKGFMVTEDYSSYESVDEEESEPAPTKGKSKGKSAVKKEDNDSDAGAAAASAKSKPSLKPSTSLKSKPSVGAGGSKGGQKNIAAFFGKPKAK